MNRINVFRSFICAYKDSHEVCNGLTQELGRWVERTGLRRPWKGGLDSMPSFSYHICGIISACHP